MSLFVQGMDIPEGCFVCPLKKFNSNDLYYYCPYIKDNANVSWFFPGTRRHPDCPCKEVPTPHGQLKDADELIKHDHQHYEHLSDEFNITVRDIENAPTVIEAEE